MRVCIVGAGAIGGLVGARLAAAGTPVSVLARGANLAAIRAAGLRLVEPDGSELVARVEASDDYAALGPHDVVVLMQNGLPWWFFQRFAGAYEGRRIRSLDPDGVIERAIPAERIVASIAYPAAERDGPG